jgi:hypothetical protein
MKQHLDELLDRIRQLQLEVEEEYRQAREDLARKQAELAGPWWR